MAKDIIYNSENVNLDKLTLISIGSLVGFGLGIIFTNYYYPISTFIKLLAPILIVMGLARAYSLRDYLFS